MRTQAGQAFASSLLPIDQRSGPMNLRFDNRTLEIPVSDANTALNTPPPAAMSGVESGACAHFIAQRGIIHRAQGLVAMTR